MDAVGKGKVVQKGSERVGIIGIAEEGSGRRRRRTRLEMELGQMVRGRRGGGREAQRGDQNSVDTLQLGLELGKGVAEQQGTTRAGKQRETGGGGKDDREGTWYDQCQR